MNIFAQTLITRDMETRLILNSAQRDVLDVMSCITSLEDLVALKKMLVNFLNERLQNELDKLWDNGTISDAKIEQWGQEHLRTPYKN